MSKIYVYFLMLILVGSTISQACNTEQDPLLNSQGLRNRKNFMQLKDSPTEEYKNKRGGQEVTQQDQQEKSLLDIAMENFLSYCHKQNKWYKREAIEKDFRPLVNDRTQFIDLTMCAFNIDIKMAEALYNGFKSEIEAIPLVLKERKAGSCSETSSKSTRFINKVN